MKQPSFFIVGAPKSGTTALCKYLNRHPEIFIPQVKEIKYFDKDIKNKEKAKTDEEYLAFFADGKDKICGEGSPSYLRSEVAAQEIHKFNPEAKIIIMLREPVALLYSFHSQLLYNGSTEDIQDFKLALAAESDRRQGKNIPKNCRNPKQLFYRDIVKFTEQIKRYFELFGRERVYIIIFDEFQQNLEKVYRETLQFLEVDPTFETSFSKINANKTIRSRFLQNLVKHPPAKVLELGKYLLPLSPKQRRRILKEVKYRLRNWNKQPATRPPLEPEFRRSLQQEFVPEIESLSQLLGRDLTHWSRE